MDGVFKGVTFSKRANMWVFWIKTNRKDGNKEEWFSTKQEALARLEKELDK